MLWFDFFLNMQITNVGNQWEKFSLQQLSTWYLIRFLQGASLVKSSHSETSLEFPVLPPVAHPRQKKHHAPLRPDSMPSGFAFEEETYSTDSNSTVADEFSPSEKLKKSKIRFPKFTRKSRQTPPPEKHSWCLKTLVPYFGPSAPWVKTHYVIFVRDSSFKCYLFVGNHFWCDRISKVDNSPCLFLLGTQAQFKHSKHPPSLNGRWGNWHQFNFLSLFSFVAGFP